MDFFCSRLQSTNIFNLTREQAQTNDTILSYSVAHFTSDTDRLIIYRDESTNKDSIIGNNVDFVTKNINRISYSIRASKADGASNIQFNSDIDFADLSQVIPPVGVTKCNANINNNVSYVTDVPDDSVVYIPNGVFNGYQGTVITTTNNTRKATTNVANNNTFLLTTTAYIKLPLNYDFDKFYDWFKFKNNPENNITSLFVDCINTTLSTIADYQILPSQHTHWKNIYVSKNLADCVAYVQGGDLPDDATISKTDGYQPDKPTPQPVPTPEDNYKDDNHSLDPASPQGVTYTDIGNLNYYKVDKDGLQQFINGFWNLGDDWSDVFFNSVTGLFSNLSNAVIDVSLYPTNPDLVGHFIGTSRINVGKSFIDVPQATSLTAQFTTAGSDTFYIPNKYNTFADYAPYTTIQLYLPFHNGWIPIDTNLVMGKGINVQWGWDVMTSTLNYIISLVDGSNYVQLMTFVENCTIKVPMSLTDNIGYATAIADKVLSVGTSALGGNPIGVLSSATSTIQPPTESLPSTSGGGVNSLNAYNYCYLLIKRPTYQRPSNMAQRLGIPYYQSDYLNALQGFAQIENPRMDFAKNEFKPYESEVNEIYSLLKEGVIF